MEQLKLKEEVHYKTLHNVKKYKYELLKCISIDIPKDSVLFHLSVETKYYSIKDGLIIGKKGYRYDGPSGPTKDDETNMRASLFHDIIYQAMREAESVDKLSFWEKIKIRRAADKFFRKILKADGMGLFRRQYYYIGVRGFGAFFFYF